MTDFIPEEKIAEIRSAADIVEIVSDVVMLKKGGKNHLGLCPFHAEKTPSFTVSPDKQIFHCFGCGEGGNVFSFVMKQENVSFPEAVKILARRYGIELPVRQMSAEQRHRLDEKERILAVNNEAASFYRHALLESPAGKKAAEYLAQRGLSRQTIDRFQIGYAPAGWDNLFTHLSRKRLSLGLIQKSGLVVPRKKGDGCYDRFRDRIVFPIHDAGNRIIGFGGRVMDDGLPKYLNSPETPVYNKSRSLYGLNLAKPYCRESSVVFIVEGYFDAIALHQHGICHTVATLGTSLTAEHVRLLRGCIGANGRAVLVYDSDEAGINAARRSVEVFDNEFVNAQILVLESGHDPDTYVFKYGAEGFKAAADKALGIFPFLLESAIRRHGMSIDGKVKIVSELQSMLAAAPDAVRRSLYIKSMAERLAIDEIALLEKVRDAAVALTAGRRPVTGDASAPYKTDGFGETLREAYGNRSGRLERQIIAMMVQVPRIIALVKELNVMDLLENRKLAEIGRVILKARERSNTRSVAARDQNAVGPDQWLDAILKDLNNDQERRAVAQMAIRDEDWRAEGCEKLIRHFVETARQRRFQEEIEGKIKEAERNRDDQLLEKLLIEKQNLAVKRERRKMALLNRHSNP